jgi:hypothetical protein
MVVSILRGLRAPSRSLLATLVFALCLGAATPALASSGTGRALGIITVHGTRSGSANRIEFNVPGVAPQSAAAKSHKGGGTPSPSTVNPLTYHGGSVFTSPYKIYDIYWVPAGYTLPSGYQSTIDGFVQNVSTDSGKITNVFYAASQYYNGAGSHVPYAASFGGSVTAADPFPASGCTDSALPAGAPCLADTQVSTEIKAVATAHGWTIGYPNIFVIMMPKGVGNCASYSTGGLEGYCSFTNACA